jgi:BCD family chlorophyll transporter-like MFS transporter
MTVRGLSWVAIVRLGFVQMALGAIVVMATSTLNRVMTVELALPATVAGALVALHYAVQMLRPRWGHGSDGGGARTPWIVGGMAVLALGGVGAAASTALMGYNLALGLTAAVAAYAAIGVGAGAAGTTLLVLLAKLNRPERRPAAAAIVWIMMIAGFAFSAGLSGRFLDPFSLTRLVEVSAVVSAIAFSVAVVAIWGVERAYSSAILTPSHAEKPPFMAALRSVWAEPQARRFTLFIFISMLAYSGQDMILEPFAGAVFGMTPGETTKLSGLHHGGVVLGMIAGALWGRFRSRFSTGLGGLVVGGCLLSAALLAFLALLASSASLSAAVPLKAVVLLLGFANGAYAVAAIGTMMTLVASGGEGREGVRMGLWGAAQGIAFGAGGFVATVLVDVARAALGSPVAAYATVFLCEAGLFAASAVLAARLFAPTRPSTIDRPADLPMPAAAIGARP